MAASRHYKGGLAYWEGKLVRVMTHRLKPDAWSWDFEASRDRKGAWVKFTLGGQDYHLAQTVAQARTRKVDVHDEVDCLAQLAMTLEDLARMAERGIYELQTFLTGFKMLPPPLPTLDEAFLRLGFHEPPERVEDVEQAYRRLAKTLHPDAGGNAALFGLLTWARDRAVELLEAGNASPRQE